MSASATRQRRSGLHARVPKPEHGASRRTHRTIHGPAAATHQLRRRRHPSQTPATNRTLQDRQPPRGRLEAMTRALGERSLTRVAFHQAPRKRRGSARPRPGRDAPRAVSPRPARTRRRPSPGLVPCRSRPRTRRERRRGVSTTRLFELSAASATRGLIRRNVVGYSGTRGPGPPASRDRLAQPPRRASHAGREASVESHFNGSESALPPPAALRRDAAARRSRNRPRADPLCARATDSNTAARGGTRV